jgi:hypothetical protein
MDSDNLFKWFFRFWIVWAVVSLGAGGTMVYFIIRALAKYVGE